MPYPQQPYFHTRVRADGLGLALQRVFLGDTGVLPTPMGHAVWPIPGSLWGPPPHGQEQTWGSTDLHRRDGSGYSLNPPVSDGAQECCHVACEKHQSSKHHTLGGLWNVRLEFHG